MVGDDKVLDWSVTASPVPGKSVDPIWLVLVWLPEPVKPGPPSAEGSLVGFASVKTVGFCVTFTVAASIDALVDKIVVVSAAIVVTPIEPLIIEEVVDSDRG